jgi:hypothetical protein
VGSFAPHRLAPLRGAAPLVVLALAALAFEADPRLPWLAGAVAAVFFAAAAAVRWWQGWRELVRLRRVADRLILQAASHAESTPLVAWRSRELTDERSRAGLCREIDRLLAVLSPDRLPSASPLNRVALRRHAQLLRLVAARLGGERPVSPKGVLLVRQLLRDPGSPLYSDRAELLLPRALTRVLSALE